MYNMYREDMGEEGRSKWEEEEVRRKGMSWNGGG